MKMLYIINVWFLVKITLFCAVNEFSSSSILFLDNISLYYMQNLLTFFYIATVQLTLSIIYIVVISIHRCVFDGSLTFKVLSLC